MKKAQKRIISILDTQGINYFIKDQTLSFIVNFTRFEITANYGSYIISLVNCSGAVSGRLNRYLLSKLTRFLYLYPRHNNINELQTIFNNQLN